MTANTQPALALNDRSNGAQMPRTMTAAARHEYGTTVKTINAEVPTPGADQVLINVHAAGVDRGTLHVMTGTPYIMRLAGFGLRKPKQPILGMDVSGAVTAVGSEVTRVQPGDEVFGIGIGTFAQFALADESKLSHKPTDVSHREAASIPISAGTALQAVRHVGRVASGERVLVLGASGGVGSYAVQIAKASGAIVTGVASGPKLDFVRSIGADEAIDYRTTDPVDGSTQYDLIIDVGGRSPLSKLRQSLTANGTLVIVGGEGGDRITGGIGRQLWAAILSPFVKQRLTFFIADEGHDWLDQVVELMASNDVAPQVDSAYQLLDVQTAVDDLADGRVQGKAVIEIGGQS